MSGMTAPTNPWISAVRNPLPLFVRIRDAAGGSTRLDEEDETADMQVLEIKTGIGAHGLPTCELKVDLGKTGRKMQDMTAPDNWGYIIEVWRADTEGIIVDEFGDEVGMLMFWGELSIQHVGIRPGSESQALVARVEPRHFGEVLLGPKVLDHTLTAQQEHTEVYFNVQRERKICLNRSSEKITGGSGHEFYAFLDPQSAENGYAIGSNGGQSLEVWTLAEAIKYLCYSLNDETWIDNPTPDEIDRVFDVAADLRSFHVRRGEYLPAILDQICSAYGFGWNVAETTAENSTNRLQIKFFRFGAGTPTNILLQKPGSMLDTSKTNCLTADMSWDIASIANRTVVHGAYIERECTFELFRAWPTSQDGYTADSLRKDDATSTYNTDSATRDAWRKWVLNEGGDYSGVRATGVAPVVTATDLSSVLGAGTVYKRRKFHDCLAVDMNKHRIDPVIEFWNPDSVGNGTNVGRWERVANTSVSLLNHECGIMFDGDSPPAWLVVLGDQARIRVTAVVRGDTRIVGESKRREDSPNAAEVTLFLDMHDAFSDRRVQKDGIYASSLVDHRQGHDIKDDTNNIKEFAKVLRDQEDAARLTASFTLHDLQPQFEIGMMIEKIDGRNISLNRFSESRGDKKYLQIVGIIHDAQGLVTRLDVDSLELKKRDMDTGTFA